MSGRWLYQQVHGRKPPRRSPRRAAGRRGPARDWRYRAWIRTLPCICCGSAFRVEAAHTGGDGGMQQKASDYSCIPACWECHTAAPYSHHRDRAEFERRVLERHGKGVPELAGELYREWRLGRAAAA